MRGLERNRVLMMYSAPTGNRVPLYDAAGHRTGEHEAEYGDPVEFRGNISPNRGNAEIEPFGSDVTYDRVILLVGDSPDIKETYKIWVDDEPYIVKAVAKSLNTLSLAVRRVNAIG